MSLKFDKKKKKRINPLYFSGIYIKMRYALFNN